MTNTSKRGFASMDNEKQRIIASKGGKAAHAKGTAHEWSSDEARAAGRKGGESRGTRNRPNQNSTLTALNGNALSGATAAGNAFAGNSMSGGAAFLNEAGSSLRDNPVREPLHNENAFQNYAPTNVRSNAPTETRVA